MKSLITFLLIFISITAYSKSKDSIGYYVTMDNVKHPFKKLIENPNLKKGSFHTFSNKLTFKYGNEKAQYKIDEIKEYHAYGKVYAIMPRATDKSGKKWLTPMLKYLCYENFCVYYYHASTGTATTGGSTITQASYMLYQGTIFMDKGNIGHLYMWIKTYFSNCNSVKAFFTASDSSKRILMIKYLNKFWKTETICNCKE